MAIKISDPSRITLTHKSPLCCVSVRASYGFVRKHARNGRLPTIHERHNNKDFTKFRSGTAKSQLRRISEIAVMSKNVSD